MELGRVAVVSMTRLTQLEVPANGDITHKRHKGKEGGVLDFLGRVFPIRLLSVSY